MLSVHKAAHKEEELGITNDLMILNNARQVRLEAELQALFAYFTKIKIICKTIINPQPSILKTGSAIGLYCIIFVSLIANLTALFVPTVTTAGSSALPYLLEGL